jgi:hypothetical protein
MERNSDFKKEKIHLHLIVTIILSLVLTTKGFSQEKSKKELKKELKEQEKIEKQKTLESLIKGKTFYFQPNTALPTGSRSIVIPSNDYFVTFESDLIDCHLPYFGRATQPMAYGSHDGGITFKEKPEVYTIKNDKDKFDIEVVVKDKDDSYNLYLSIRSEGYATLRIVSNRRTPISFNGEILPLKKEQ